MASKQRSRSSPVPERSSKEQSPTRPASASSKDGSSSSGVRAPPKAGSTKQQQVQSVVAVFPENKSGNRAYEALQMAVKDLKHTQLDRLPFEKLDYGETDSLAKFYSANVVVVDVTERNMQAALFYQLGMRENFDMKNNVVTTLETQSAFSEAALSSSDGDVQAPVSES